MEYQVPQFIEVEDKIVGPLTLRQFIYSAGGAGLCVLFYFELPFILAVPLIMIFGGLAVALAFYKVNGKPFSSVLEAAFSYYTGSKLFLWKREETQAKIDAGAAASARAAQAATQAQAAKRTPKLTSGKLHELAWSLDIKTRDETK